MLRAANTVNAVAKRIRHKGTTVWSLPPGASVYEAIEKMADKSVGALLVMEEGRLAGLISERDYTREVILKWRLSRETQVANTMSSPVLSVTPKHTVDAAPLCYLERVSGSTLTPKCPRCREVGRVAHATFLMADNSRPRRRQPRADVPPIG